MANVPEPWVLQTSDMLLNRTAPHRLRRPGRMIPILLCLVLAGGAAGLIASLPASAVEGAGQHTGVKNNRNGVGVGTCVQASSDYQGTGTAVLKDGDATYNGPVTVKYMIPNMYYNPSGTYTIPGCPPASLSAVGLNNASLTGTSGGASVQCQWDTGTFQRVGAASVLAEFFPGNALPAEGQPGTCTIKPAQGPPKTSNTRVRNEGNLFNCDGGPPTRCEVAYAMTAVTEGPRAPDPAPTVASLTPGSIQQGMSGQMVNVTGANFAPGVTMSISGSGVTVELATYTSNSSILARVSAALDASVGPRDVTVTNTGGASGVCTGCFQVTQAPPPPPPAQGGPNTGGGGSNTGGGTGGGDSNALSQGGLGKAPGSTGGSGQAAEISGAPASKPPPPSSAPPPEAVINVPPPAPPGGSGFVPGGVPLQVPGGVPVQAPVGAAMASAEEQMQAAPERGARIMMTARPPGGVPQDLAFASAGLAMLLICMVGWSKGATAPPHPEGIPMAAPAFAVTGG